MTIQRKPLLALFSALLAVGAFACSDDALNASDASTPKDGAVVDKDGAVVDKDGAVVDNDSGPVGGDGGTDAVAGSTKGGAIFLSQTKTVAGATTIFSTYAGAAFSLGGGTSSTACTTTKEGACNVIECDLTPPPVSDAGAGDAGTPPAAPTSGDITISGGKIPAATPIVLSADATGAYTGKSGTVEAYAKDDMLSAKSAGKEVPAFDQKVAAPGDITTTPALSFTTPTAVPKGADFKLDWTGGGAGNVTVSLSTAEATKKSVSISCTATGASGTVTVPKAALGKLQTTSGTTITGTISASPSNATTFMAGDYTVSLSASATGGFGSMTTTP